MTQQTTGRDDDNGLKQARKKGNKHIHTRKEGERGGDSRSGGAEPGPRLSIESDRIVLDSFWSLILGVQLRVAR